MFTRAAFLVRRRLACLVAALSFLLLAAPAISQDVWIDPGADHWFDPLNWQDATTPTDTDVAVIDNGGTAIVAGAGAVADSIAIGNANGGTLQIEGAGTLSTLDGSGQGNDNALAVVTGSTGIATVSGPLATWNNETSLVVGLLGTGTLDISGGGTVTSAEGFLGAGAIPDPYEPGIGMVTIAGAGSSWTMDGKLTVGLQGSGTLIITGGGTVSSGAGDIGGGIFGGAGTVTVDGSDSTWAIAGNLSLSNSSQFGQNPATSTLTIQNGGTVNVDGVFLLASIPTTAGVLNIGNGGAAGILNTASVANVGFVGAGAGVVNFNHTDSDYYFTNNGMAGGAAIDIIGGMPVNHIGSGKTTLTGNNTYIGGTMIDAGTLSVSSDTNLGDAAGTLSFNGGTLQTTADFTMNRPTTLNAGGGTFDVSAANLVQQAVITGDGRLTKHGNGTLLLTGTNDYAGGTTVNHGTLQVTGSISHTGALLVVGENSGDDATLSITDGGQISSFFSRVGDLAGSVGHAEVSGTGSQWINQGGSGFDDLHLGLSGSGSLDVLSGGEVVSRDGTLGIFSGVGSALISGGDSTWDVTRNLSVGGSAGQAGGQGTLTVEDGGTVTVGGTLKVWGGGQINQTTSGAIAVSDGDLSVFSSCCGIHIGAVPGTGVLEIVGGGDVSGTIGSLGFDAGTSGTATVSGTGSTWTNSSELRVGSLGAGILNIEDGGTVSNASTGSVGLSVGSTGTVDVTGADSAWTNTSALRVGNSGTGTLSLRDGGTVNVTGAFTLALGEGSSGTLNIGSGGPAGIVNSPSVGGGAGTATLNFNHTDAEYFFTNDGTSGGTAVVITGSTFVNHIGPGTTVLTGNNTYTSGTTVKQGELRVTGGSISQGAGITDVGDESGDNGTLRITGGGTVTQSGVARIGNSAGSTGSVTVDGATSDWTVDSILFVGVEGNGTLNVQNGGAVSSSFGNIAFVAGTGVATIDGASSNWTISNDLAVGGSSTGTLTVRNGGTVEVNGNLRLARFGGGTGSTLNIGSGGGAGIVNAAAVQGVFASTLNFNHSDADYFFTDNGTFGGAAVAITGSTAVSHLGSGTTTLAGNHTYAGATTVDAGTLLVDGSITSATTVNPGGTLGGSGSVGDVVVAGGTLAPGTSAGLLTVDNVTFQTGSTFEVELAGDGGVPGTDFDQLVVNSTATLGGDLAIELLGGFVPTAVDSFTVLSANMLTGAFANVADGARLDALGGEGSFRVSYDGSSNAVVLSDFMLTSTGLPGDFNGDGKVNGADFLLWQRDTSIGNLADWQANYGATMGGGSSTSSSHAAVPEPATVMLLMFSAAYCCLRRSRVIGRVPATH